MVGIHTADPGGAGGGPSQTGRRSGGAGAGQEPTRIHAAWPVEDWTDAAAAPGGGPPGPGGTGGYVPLREF